MTQLHTKANNWFSYMDFTESTKIVYGRIQKLEHEHASKIVGFLLLQDNSNREMIRLAFSPDNVILCIINKVKAELGLFSPIQPSFLQNALLQSTNSYWNPSPDHNISLLNPSNDDPTSQDYLRLPSQMQLLNLDNDIDFSCNNRYYARLPGQGSGLAEFPSKICHYFANGFCKNGSNCRFLHANINDVANEDPLFSPRSLEMLEVELAELLRSRNGLPISIATLPLLYYEMYGKSLQADGYVSDSQRHGKAGYTLTRLLDRMRTSIRLIARAHGQHSVILAEDLPMYLDHGNELVEHGGRPAAARQIYLTFPADSNFTEEDVSNHFNAYGPVLDVRLPSQQKRMFGFVTFVYPETVMMILARGNPHFIGGARILVKPYKENPRYADRRTAAERRPQAYFGLQFLDGDSNPQLVPRTFFDTRHPRTNFVEECEGELELERRRLSEFQLVANQVASPHGNGYSTAGLKLKEAAAYGEQAEFQDSERFSFLFNSLSDISTSEERARCISSTCNDPNSNQGLNAPESPFANSIKRMSTVM